MAQLKYNSIENEQDVQLNAEDILNMDLDDLMNLEVKVGNISGTTSKRLPVSVTTITKEQIELSNVQNLLHLIQIYVPGASYWRHSEGPMIGMRGITSDRNNKLLMTLNGIVINQKAHNGVIHELEDWNMEDIEKVEIIRGPGSVTYGPGAIAGVINIVTKKAGELDGLKASAQYVTKYNNKTASLSYGFKKEKVKGYFHAGIAKTEGFIPDGMLMTNDSISVRGINQPGSVFEAPAQTYMGDFNDEPQIKLLADINFLDDFNFTARYNKSGASVGSYSTPQSKPIIGFDEKNRKILQNYEDRSFQSQQQLLLSLKNASHIESSNVDIETEFAYTSADYLRTRPASEIYDT